MANLDKTIHQPVRLRIMASLVTLKPDERIDFTSLRDLLDVTSGNLGAHVLRLEEAKYIDVVKTYVGRRPRTFISASVRGRSAYRDHVEALNAIVRGIEKP